MNKRWLFSFLIGVSVLVVITGGGCRSLSSEGRGAPEIEAQPGGENGVRLGDALLAAFVDDDANSFVALLPEVMQKEFTVKSFAAHRKTMEKELGKPVSFRYMGTLEHPLLKIDIFAVRFERRPIGAAGDGQIFQESVFRTVSGELEGKMSLLSFHFM
ncbi:MAG: hypothetical protein PHI35_01920 [Victivallaceae bacterium]|nr:hypothetical protein [Victivallaceae bacterium]